MAHAIAMTAVQIGPFIVAGFLARRWFRRGVTGVLVGLAAVGLAIAIALHSHQIVDGSPSPAWKTPVGQRLKTNFISTCQGRGFDCDCVFERMTKNETTGPGEFADLVVNGAAAVQQTQSPSSAPADYRDALNTCRS